MNPGVTCTCILPGDGLSVSPPPPAHNDIIRFYHEFLLLIFINVNKFKWDKALLKFEETDIISNHDLKKL